MVRNLGEMKHRITFRQRTPDAGTDAKGYPAEAWQDVCKAWAYREDVGGKEFFASAAVQMEETVAFTIHWREGLDTSMRVVHRGVPYEIIHIGGGRNVGDLLTVRARRVEKEGQGGKG